MNDIFGSEGILVGKNPNFRFRPNQLKMAQAISENLESHSKMVIEAGTGIGKTLAYLIPALTWAQKNTQRILVVTASHALQEQIISKDVPLVQEILGKNIRAYILKGRNNYLCKRRMQNFKNDPFFHSPSEIELFDRIVEWSEQSEFGDRAEIHDLPDDHPLWNQIKSTTDTCLGPKCSLYRESFSTLLRKKALDSDLVIVNYHLFFADLILRERATLGIIPDYGAIIFDEAHCMEDIATEFFGISVSSLRFADFVFDLRKWVAFQSEHRRKVSSSLSEILRLGESLQVLNQKFFSKLDDKFQELSYRSSHYSHALMLEPHSLSQDTLFARESLKIQEILQEIEEKLNQEEDETFRQISLVRRAPILAQELEFLVSTKDDRFVYTLECREGQKRRSRFLFLKAFPIEVAQDLRTRLLDSLGGAVFTSATLAIDGKLDFFNSRIGLQHQKETRDPSNELILPSHFDYSRQALLYIPRDQPQPHCADFCESISWQIEKILTYSEGRALVLFTTLKNMRNVFDRLRDRLPYPMLLQGMAPKGELLKKFREDTQSVLFASSSFWEGVDIQGESLSCVIIDKIPFLPPDDPVVAARLRLLEGQGGRPFWDFQVPSAILALKQGVGRLIRHHEDRGLVALLDSRLWKKSYGKIFRQNLSFMPITDNLLKVGIFFGKDESGDSKGCH